MLTESHHEPYKGCLYYFHEAELSDLFEGHLRIESHRGMPPRPDGYLWVQVSDHRYPLYQYLQPTVELADWIDANMLSDFGLYVKLTFREDDTCLISLSYDQIIGSRWLCQKPAAEVDALMRLVGT